MSLTGEAKKLYQREYMRMRRSNKDKLVCQACSSKDYIHAHHPDYSRPLDVIYLCSSCHKKAHLCLAGKQRTTSNPYINPLNKVIRKQPSVADKLRAAGLTLNDNRIVSTAKLPPVPTPNVTIPLYDPSKHKPGDRVLIKRPYGKRLIEVVIPELDLDGNPIPEG